MAPGLGDMLKIGAVFKDGAGQDVVNVFHVEIMALGSGGIAGLNADIQEYIDDLYSDIKPDINADVDGYLIEIQNLTQGVVYGPVGFDPSFTGGNASGSTLPSPISCLVLARTGVPRRVGRKYLPPYTSANLASGAWTSGTITRANAFGSKWLDEFTGSQDWSLMARVASDDLSHIEAIEACVAQPVVAYQRRRKSNRGS